MPLTVDMQREFVDEEDYNFHADCGGCGREEVWVNFAGSCADCVERAEKDQEKKDVSKSN